MQNESQIKLQFYSELTRLSTQVKMGRNAMKNTQTTGKKWGGGRPLAIIA